MPANAIEINGCLKYDLGDSKMPPLLKWLDTYSYAALGAEGEKPDTIFAEMMTLMAKAHYGEDFEFRQCVIDFDIDDTGSTVQFNREVTGMEG
jgi:hypothetical protein